jgi:hypothetical protein
MPNLEDGGNASGAGDERTGDHSDEILVAVPAPNSRARVLLEIGRTMLDDHLRWCQINYRSYEGQRGDGSPGGFGAVENRGKLKREWRTSAPLSMPLLLPSITLRTKVINARVLFQF